LVHKMKEKSENLKRLNLYLIEDENDE